jgi:hypothetical protein
MFGRWKYVRAALIAVAIAAALVEGMPLPTAAVMEKLPLSLREATMWLGGVRAALLVPFAPLQGIFHVYQRWPLFSTTGGIRHRMWIEARGNENEPFTLLYRPLDPEHRYLADTLEFRRVRNAWNPHRRSAKDGYPAFATWIARRIFVDHPEFNEVRVSMERVRIVEHAEGYVPAGGIAYNIVHRRRELLP